MLLWRVLDVCIIYHFGGDAYDGTLLTLLNLLDMDDDDLIKLEHTRDSIYFNKLTFASALLSSGGAIETCLAVARGRVKNAVAVVRPPGHHAEHDQPMGFCLFNNVSVAARVCQKELGEGCRKIMILDWDVHHGISSLFSLSLSLSLSLSVSC